MNGKLGYAGGRMIENIGPRLCCKPDANKKNRTCQFQIPFWFLPEAPGTYLRSRILLPPSALGEQQMRRTVKFFLLPHKNLYHDIQQGEIRGTNWNFQDNNQISLTPQSRPGTYIRSNSHRNFQENSETTETSRSAPSMLERIVNRKLGIS